MPKRLARFAGSKFPQATLPDAKALFSRPDGTPVQAGDLLRNPAYAATLRTIAERGPRALLEGSIARQIVERTHAEPLPGTMTEQDLAAYRPRVVEPVCGPFRIYVVCVPPPPSSGVSLLQLLAILDSTDIATRGPADPQAWFLYAEASRLMYADRVRHVADPAFVKVPVVGLLDPSYVAGRTALIGGRAAPAPVAPGYFNETEQREPVASVSRFAAEQGLEFRDYDFFARRFGVSDLRSVCWEVFAPQTDLSAIIAALNRSPSVRFNTVAMQVAELTEAGRLRSVTGDGYWLHYLGRFEYEPRET